MANITFKVERSVTLSHTEVIETKVVECNYLETKAIANELARKHFGNNIRLSVYDNCYEVHIAGVVVRPCSTLLGFIFYE